MKFIKYKGKTGWGFTVGKIYNLDKMIDDNGCHRETVQNAIQKAFDGGGRNGWSIDFIALDLNDYIKQLEL